jgi:hypothetical protein
MFKDPPHQPHSTQILPGTILDAPTLTSLDAPRQETPWCMQHDERMQNRSVHPPGERRDYRYATLVRPPPFQQLDDLQFFFSMLLYLGLSSHGVILFLCGGRQLTASPHHVLCCTGPGRAPHGSTSSAPAATTRPHAWQTPASVAVPGGSADGSWRLQRRRGATALPCTRAGCCCNTSLWIICIVRSSQWCSADGTGCTSVLPASRWGRPASGHGGCSVCATSRWHGDWDAASSTGAPRASWQLLCCDASSSCLWPCWLQSCWLQPCWLLPRTHRAGEAGAAAVVSGWLASVRQCK